MLKVLFQNGALLSPSSVFAAANDSRQKRIHRVNQKITLVMEIPIQNANKRRFKAMFATALLFVVTSVAAGPGGQDDENDGSPVFEKDNLPAASYGSASSAFLQRRDVPEALIDPYSVLGVLSFGVYIFYILYHRYQMGMGNLKHGMGGQNGNGQNPIGGAPTDPVPGGTNLFSMGSEQQNLAYMLDILASKILHAVKVKGNSLNGTDPLLYSFDYYEDTSDMPTL